MRFNLSVFVVCVMLFFLCLRRVADGILAHIIF
jgi:hypothetical protein